MTWGELFARAPDDVSVDEVRTALAERRTAVATGDDSADDGTGGDA